MTDDDPRVRVGVGHLLASYQYLADTGKVERLAQLFAPDGVLEIGSESHAGAEDVLAFFRSAGASFVAADLLPARHHLSSIYVEPQSDGSAKTYACFQFIGTRGLDHWGTYRDVAVPASSDAQDGGGWRFRHRRVIVEGFSPGSSLAPEAAPAT